MNTLSVCALMALGFQAAGEDELIAVRYSGDVISIDHTDGTPQAIGSTGYSNVNSLDRDIQGRLIAAAHPNGTNPPSQFIEIEPDSGNGTLLGTFTGPPNHTVRAIAFAPDGTMYFTTNVSVSPLEAWLWSAPSPETADQAILIGDDLQHMQGLTFSPDGVLYGWDTIDALVTIDPQTGEWQDVDPLIGDADYIAQSIAFGPDGVLYGAWTALHTIDLTTGAATQVGPAVLGDVRGLAWTAAPEPDCFEIIAEEIICHADGTTFTYEVHGIDCTGVEMSFVFTASGAAPGEQLCFTAVVSGPEGYCCTTELCVTVPDCSMPQGTAIVAVGDNAGVLRVFDVIGGPVLWEDNVGSAIQGVEFSGNGNFLLVGAQSSLRLYRRNGDVIDVLPLGVPSGTSFVPDNHPVGISSDGAIVAATHVDDTVRLYVNNGTQLTELWSDFLSNARTADISADGTAIIAGGSQVKYYDDGGDGWAAGDGTPLFTNSFDTRIVAIADDGQYGVAGRRSSSSASARVYSKQGLQLEIPTLPTIVTVDMSGDGTLVATGNDDAGDSAGARLDIYSDGGDGWDGSDSTPICSFDASPNGNDDIRAITFAPVASKVGFGGASSYGRTRVLDVDQCSVVLHSTLNNETLSVDMTNDGALIAACGRKRAWVATGSGEVDPLVLFQLPAGSPAFNAIAVSEEPALCPYDLDGDADVGMTDLLALLALWDTDPAGPPDFDGSGTVGIVDFLMLMSHWGTCP